MSEIAKTPAPPYYAVIFTSHRTPDDNGYSAMAEKMVELASQQLGFLGIDSAREVLGITVSYWADMESIKAWKLNAEHLVAQERLSLLQAKSRFGEYSPASRSSIRAGGGCP